MTEIEAIREIRNKACNDRCTEIHCNDSCMYGKNKCAFQMAIESLEKQMQIPTEKTYEEGLNDAWELARTYEKMSMAERKRILGVDVIWEILNLFTPQEALAKLKGYEEKQIKVGDVVVADCDGFTTMGMFYAETKDGYWILDPSCTVPQSLGKDRHLTKTGKHIDIESLLGQIRGE